ncbi:MAG: SDR family oxidoreductase [Deltaproteobacteria bacterium]|nr:SDR family oxidoreductase [Deltaproteobacteria bacterium]
MKDPFSVDGKRCLITGGTSGIGLAAAKHLAGRGATVVISGRRESGHAIAEEIGATFIQADVSKPDQVKRLIKEGAEALIGKIDFLFLNAGMSNRDKMIDDLTVEEMRELFAINFDHVFAGIHYAVPYMTEYGSILLAGSAAGNTTGATFADYAPSKAALSMLARTVGIELGPRKIRVNCLVPGLVITPMIHPGTHDWPFANQLIVGEPRQPEEIAPFIQLMASDASRPMTGCDIVCDDGISAGFSIPAMTAVAEKSEREGIV